MAGWRVKVRCDELRSMLDALAELWMMQERLEITSAFRPAFSSPPLPPPPPPPAAASPHGEFCVFPCCRGAAGSNPASACCGVAAGQCLRLTPPCSGRWRRQRRQRHPEPSGL